MTYLKFVTEFKINTENINIKNKLEIYAVKQ